MKPTERSEAKGAQECFAMTDNRAGRLRPKAGKNHDRLRNEVEHPEGGCMAAHEGRYGMKCAGMRPGLACVFLSRRREDSRPLFPSHTHTSHTHTTNTHTERLTRTLRRKRHVRRRCWGGEKVKKVNL
jgi:hypothetical protein